MTKCSGITQAGTACKGIPIDGSQWCYVHHPDHAEERRRHGSKGGKRGGRGRPQAELGDIKRRLSDLAEDVLEGRQDRGVAVVASQVLNVYLRAVSVELKAREQLELIERLEALEEGLEQQKGGRRYGVRGKLRRLERRSEGETVTLVCQECGKEFRVAEDTDVELVAWDWIQYTGEKSYQPTPKDVFVIVEHEYGASALVKKATGEPWPF